MTIFLFALVSVLVLVGGQASLKYGLIRSGGISGESMLVLGTWVKVMSEPYVLTGFALYGVASALWLRVLSELELSLAYPIVSLSPNPPMRSGLGVGTRGEGRGTRRSALDSDKWGRWRPLVGVGGADGGPGQRRWGGVGGTACKGRQSRTGPVRLCGVVE